MVLLALGLACDGLFGGSDSDALLNEDNDADTFSENEGDCDDAEPRMYPGADESCDGLDNDCDGLTDEGVVPAWFFDEDADGFGAGDPVLNCVQPANYIPTSGDCDDGDPSVNPDGVEVCDEVDQDCDDAIDEGTQSAWFTDEDGDGYGTGEGIDGCDQPDGTADNDYDCDDTVASTNPAASDGCNDIDDDCDEAIDEEPDVTWYTDADGDGWGDAEAPVVSCEALTGTVDDDTDCDDTDPAIHPETVWYVDDDNDGFGQSDISLVQCDQPAGHVLDDTDCDGAEPSIYPGATEECDGIDEDCDDSIDEGVATTYYADTDGDGYGDASSTQDACTVPSGYAADSTDCDDDDGDIHPGATETCDDEDEDCDSTVDEDASDASTWYADSDGDGYGDASSTQDACVRPSGYVSDATDCDDSTDEVSPDDTETCNSVDDDCDSSTDEGVTTTYYADTDGDGYGDPSSTTEDCSVPSGYTTDDTDCDDSTSAVSPAESEICGNGVDDDCDGGVGSCGVSGLYDTSSSSGYEFRFVGSAASDKLGYGVLASADSLIGDTSTTDLVMGAIQADGGGTNSGAVWIQDGPVTAGGDASTVTEQLTGGTYDNCGASVAEGDFDGDGVSDLAVGCYNREYGSWTPGAVHVALGPLTSMNLSSASDATIWGSTSTSSDDFGEYIASGDLNGDGTADLLVAATGYKSGSGSTYAGRAYIIHGPFSATHTAADGTLTGASGQDYLGEGVAIVPDTNGDGNDDVLVGADENDALGSGNGAAYLLLGPATGTHVASNSSAGTVDAWLRGDEGNESFGYAVHGDDLDGDGYGDLIVSAPDAGSSLHGYVAIWFGPVTGTSRTKNADVQIDGDTSGYRDGLGHGLATGDLDDDGDADLIVGCTYGYNTSNQPGGIAYVFSGPVTASFDASDADAQIDSATNGDHLGETVAAGDIDGDGVDDLLVSAVWANPSSNDQGAVYLFLGGSL